MHASQSSATDDLEEPLIGYAPAAAAHPIRSFIRRHVRLILLMLLAASALWWVPIVWHRAQVMYWQAQCAEYVVAPGTVIADEQVARTRPPPPNVPKAWTRFYELLSPPGLSSDATVFLHKLQRPSGEPVLVAVDLSHDTNTIGVAFASLQVRAFRPGRGMRLPFQLQNDVPIQWLPLADLSGYRFYAGQADPADPTHFTLTYQVGDSKPQVIDGWVREQSVQLEEREPPIPPPPTSAAKSP